MTYHLKICGLRDSVNTHAARKAGATMVGLVFFPKSPRHVTVLEARDVCAASGTLDRVGLFVDPDDALLDTILSDVPLTHLQLHGTETPDRVSRIKKRTGLPIIKALGIATADDLNTGNEYTDIADLLIFDAKPPKEAAHPGGLGHVFDWTVLKEVSGQTPWILSGGLTPENVANAINAVGQLPGFSGVDVSSGVEIKPGIKSADTIARFLSTARGAMAAL